MIFHTKSSIETISLGEKIGSLLKPGDILAMTGTLAAGKTTITKGIAKSLGVKDNITSQIKAAKPDFIEVLPALMPKAIAKVCRISSVPVITGGLVSDKEDVMALLDAGVISISSTNEQVWFL